MRSMRTISWAVAVAVVVTAAPAYALPQEASQAAAQDEVTLNDGSVMKGTIIFVESDYLYFESEFYDPIKISLFDIRSVTTADYVDVVLDNFDRVRAKISANAQGEMVMTPEGSTDAQPLNFGFVAGVYQTRSIWDHNLTVGLSSTTGNSEVLGFSASGKGQRDTEEHRFTWIGQFTYAEADGREVEQNGTATLKYDYFLRPRFYLAATEELYHNKAKDVKVRSVTSASLGYVVLRHPYHKLEAELGGGLLAQRYYEQEDVDEFAVRGSAYYEMPIGKSFSLEDLFVIYVGGGSDRYQIQNTFTFEWSITGRWGLEVKNLFNHDSEEFFGEASDSQWTLGLSYTF